MDEKLVTVARFDSYMEAELAQQKLGDYGIKAVVMGENVGNTYAVAPVVQDIELQTFESQAKEAVDILANREPQE
jgi:hypothetical protein